MVGGFCQSSGDSLRLFAVKALLRQLRLKVKAQLRLKAQVIH
jgi:hypothetical protein